MSDTESAATRPETEPEFRDAASCTAWLQSLPLINVGPSHGRLLRQLEILNQLEPSANERLKMLELLREAVLFVQTEHAKKFSGRPIPISEQEREIFRSVIALWDALARGYRRCLEAPGDDAKPALACQRALWCIGRRIAEHYKGYMEIPGEDWEALHRVYALAEERGVAGDAVSHPVYKGKAETNCIETYARALLLHLANPNEHPPRQTALIARWLERWSRKVTLSRTAPAEQNNPLRVDLAGSSGASRAGEASDSVRYLDVREVARSVKKRVALLRRGETPAALGLGDDITPATAEPLLVMLYRQWCEDKQSRAHVRRAAVGTAQLCAELSVIHHYVSGRRFRQPVDDGTLSQRQHEEIATFGRVATRRDDDRVDASDQALETWQIEDESMAGLRLTREDRATAGRYQLHQLIAARPADGKSFILGMVRWLSVSAETELSAGIRTLPGMPQAVSVRATGLNATTEKYVPALLLPAVPGLQSPESLVLPTGWYRPKRVVELSREGSANVLLLALLERGSDFERVSFEPA